ncbi:MAG: tryptophan synthase subunit alpha [Desulfobulbaceae bacterium]|nr:tryptophan synthase subunit alpha [Desulfobulbaceae bacterium]
MKLGNEIQKALEKKKILLMTHLVLGYPSFDVNRRMIDQMVENGVDLIELQIPFSDPVADGPTILKANQAAISSGLKVMECIDFAEEIISTYSIPFLFMTYFNIMYKFGWDDFMDRASAAGIRGFIVPDLPPEEGADYFKKARERDMGFVQIFAPTSTEERMRELSSYSEGFIYCVARKGVTGKKTDFDDKFNSYLSRCRQATSLPLAVGFGIRGREDVDSLSGKAEIAVIGTETIRIVNEEGVDAVGPFIAGLR